MGFYWTGDVRWLMVFIMSLLQIEMWKRKCSELQNVPVIEEISE